MCLTNDKDKERRGGGSVSLIPHPTPHPALVDILEGQLRLGIDFIGSILMCFQYIK